MKSKTIRGCVYVIENTHGGIYEATDDPDMLIVTLCQREVWFENNTLVEHVKEVPWLTDMSLLYRNCILPGNIYNVYQTDPITEDSEFCLLWSEDKVVRTATGLPVYSYSFYDPDSLYQPNGVLEGEDNLIDIL